MRLFTATIFATALLAGCSSNNVNTDDSLEPVFKNNAASGCFALLNNANGEFTMYNLPRYRDSAFTPAGSFDIVTGLVGLQTGVLASDSSRLPSAGPSEPDQSCSAEETFNSAFKKGCNAYFKELARRIGPDTLKHWVDSLAYGNKKIGAPDAFWLDNSLRLRPDEQLGLIKRLYFNQLPFFKLNQELVKKAMLVDPNPKYRLGCKTAITQKPNGDYLVWLSGWIEENGHPYFYVLNFQSHDQKADMATKGKQMLEQILKKEGFLEGKK